MYLILLLLLTLSPFSENVVMEKEYNTVLFHSISNYWNHMERVGWINEWALTYFPGNLPRFIRNLFTVSFVNLAGNVVLFLPMGWILGKSSKKQGVLRTLVACFFLSAGIEVAQFIGLSSRIADVDDVLLNVLGGGTGYLLYKIFHRRKKEGRRISHEE